MTSTPLLFELRKMANITTTTFCLFCAIPQQGFYAAPQIQEIAVNLAKLGEKKVPPNLNFESVAAHLNYTKEQTSLDDCLAKSFENLAILVGGANDSHTEVEQFFQSFINQINLQNGSSLTIEEACNRIRENVDSLPIPIEYREHLLLGLDLMNKSRPTTLSDVSPLASIYWPWEWNWFGLNKKDKEHHKHKEVHSLKTEKWKVAAFGLFCCAIILVAVFAPAALSVAVPALSTGAQILMQ